MNVTQSQGYFAMPSSGNGPGVLVLHAWWGLNDFFRGFCDRLAQQGFISFAPDMFSGELAHTIEEAQQHQSQWNEVQAVPPIILPAVDDLSKRVTTGAPGLGVIGFSMGAYWALWLAQQKPELFRAVVLFYGSDGGSGNYQRSSAAFLGHFAENDPYETASAIQAMENNLKAAHRPATFYTYPGTSHWFFENDRPDAYHAQAAQLAWDRTLSFLDETIART
jgi:carboxymethylenebutenolidase